MWQELILFFFISYNYLLFIILFITYFIFMLCPQLASAKYIDTWIKFIIIIIIIIIKLDNNSMNLILILVLSSKSVGVTLTGVQIRFSLLRQL